MCLREKGFFMQKAVVNVRIEEDVLAEIERLAARENRSRSNFIRHLILLGLDEFRDNDSPRREGATS